MIQFPIEFKGTCSKVVCIGLQPSPYKIFLYRPILSDVATSGFKRLCSTLTEFLPDGWLVGLCFQCRSHNPITGFSWSCAKRGNLHITSLRKYMSYIHIALL